MRAIILGLVATLALAACGDSGLPNVSETSAPQASSTTPPPADTGNTPVTPVDPGEIGGTDAAEEVPVAELPSDWILYAAQGKVSVGGAAGSRTFGGPGSECSVLVSADDQVVFISNFWERPDARNLAPRLAYTDRGDGFAIWGLYVGYDGERGEEWSGTGQGTPTLSAVRGEFALIAPGGITFDPAGQGLEPDGEAMLIRAQWSGEANENFSTEKSAGSIEVKCLFVEATKFRELQERARSGS